MLIFLLDFFLHIFYIVKICYDALKIFLKENVKNKIKIQFTIFLGKLYNLLLALSFVGVL